MACKYATHWDWKTGDAFKPHALDIKGKVVKFNYFTCGTYYFDGEYFVVKFPKGMQLYHGSGPLANSLAEFPLGKEFYDSVAIDTIVPSSLVNRVKRTNKSVEELLSKNLPISMSWYADPLTAQKYSRRVDLNTYAAQCGNRCVSVYELTRNAVFFQLDNDYNIFKILQDRDISDDVRRAFGEMFDIESTDESEPHYGKFGEILFERKRRNSVKVTDRKFANWLCSNKRLARRYAGYAANTQQTEHAETLHLEFMFCNPLTYMRRNLSNELDWQYNQLAADQSIPPIMSQFIKQLSYYKSYNVNFHAGNLFEHSVWSLLFAEDLGIHDSLTDFDFDDRSLREVAAIAFIHDIGKMTITDPNVTVRKHDVVFSSLPSHPKLGGDYIRGDKRLPVLDGDMKQIGFLDVNLLLDALGLSDMNRHELAKIVDLHWEFGAAFSRIRDDSFTSLNLAADKFIDVCGVNESVKFYAYLVIVSMADILASQPYRTDAIIPNAISTFFPYISNVPKKYRGGNVGRLNVSRRDTLVEIVMRKVRGMRRK